MKRAELFFTSILVPFDYLVLVAAGVAAYYSRFHPWITNIQPVTFELSIQQFIPVVLAISALWIVVFALIGLYRIGTPRVWDELIKVVIACSAGVAVILGIVFFSRDLFESRYIVLAAWLFAILFVAGERLLMRGLQRALMSAGVGVRHVAIIGKNKTANGIREGLKRKPSLGMFVVAQYETFNAVAKKKLLALKKKGELDEIILADPDASKKIAQEILTFSEHEQLIYKYTADMFSASSIRTATHTYAGIPIIEVKKTPLDGWGAIYKRLFDIVISLILILVTLPIQIVVAVALFAESPRRRILWSRLPNGKKTMRIGEGGREFHYFKFQTMVKDAHKLRFDPEFIKKHGNEREGTPLFKLADDPRITPVGRFVRKYSLDELPEFFLVFLGRMSLVGPRPHLPEEVESYRPEQRRVLAIKPGITGMAQISGRADLEFDEEVRLDMFYIENWTPYLDLYILLKTPFVVLFKRGAY